MGVIRILPPGLVNRIAAGECVERPSSVLKELVENALDAGAGRIDVQILEGGRDLIQVSDDGVGMDADDLRLSVQPHATSKLHADDDLFDIHTLGFRGEALPSIGSVARLRITSRRADSDVAQRIAVDGGQIGEIVPCAAAPGTTVEVRDLFYCVPARRKFLKTNSTETGHLTEQLARIALAHPGVAFTLTHGKRDMHKLPAVAGRLERIADLFGVDVSDGLLAVARRSDDFALEGFVAPPARCRRSSKWEYVFVNGRYIRDRFVSHAIKEAYRSLIKPDEYPVAFLFLSLDPGQLDVNVHPTKIEVRWRDSNYIHSQVLAALREKFLSTNLDRGFRTPAHQAEQRESVRAAMVAFFTGREGGTQGRRDESAETGTRAAIRTRPDVFSDEPGIAAPEREGPYVDGAVQSSALLLGHQTSGLTIAHPPPRSGSSAEAEPFLRPASAAAPPQIDPRSSPLDAPRALQVHNTYLVVEASDGVLLIDQHALHERILYEELRTRITARPLESQRLLLPDVVRVPPDRLEVPELHAETLARLGIELTPTGPQTITLHAFPSLLERADRLAFVRDLLDLLSEPGVRPETDTLLHRLLDMMACKAAVKAGDPLTAAEIAALLAQRDRAERSSHCPHGRPTTLHLALRDLERQFKRR